MRELAMRQLFVLVVLAACGGNKVDRAISEAEDLKTKMCACAENDRACADKVSVEFRDWRKGLKSDFTKDEQKSLPADQKARFTKALDDLEICGKKAHGDDNTVKVGAMITTMGQYKAKMCACNDKACVDAVQKEAAMWTAGEMHDAGKLKLSDDDQKKLGEIGKQMADCAAAGSK
jgi:hypothetical protein